MWPLPLCQEWVSSILFWLLLLFFLVSLQSQAYLKCYRSKLGALITNPNLISVFCLPFRVAISPIPSLCS